MDLGMLTAKNHVMNCLFQKLYYDIFKRILISYRFSNIHFIDRNVSSKRTTRARVQLQKFWRAPRLGSCFHSCPWGWPWNSWRFESSSQTYPCGQRTWELKRQGPLQWGSTPHQIRRWSHILIWNLTGADTVHPTHARRSAWYSVAFAILHLRLVRILDVHHIVLVLAASSVYWHDDHQEWQSQTLGFDEPRTCGF